MFTTLDRYILRRIVLYSAAMIGLAMACLLLERLLRILDLAVNPGRVLDYISQMLINLIPHYLGVALPMAFFLGVLLTFNRLSRDNELAAMSSSGIGLHRLMIPVLLLAVLLAGMAAATFSHLQPLTRYSYRAMANSISHASLSAAVRERTFVHSEGLTFIAEAASPDGGELGRVFVFEEKAPGKDYVTTAEEGRLRDGSGANGSVLVLYSGRRIGFETAAPVASRLDFDRFQWPLEATEGAAFRARGKDERELTMPELWGAMAAPVAGIKVAEARAEFHARLAAVLSILVLPLLAVPLALGGGRGGQSYGIALGLLILVVFKKVLNFGETFADKDLISPWIGIWLPFTIFALCAGLLSHRVAFAVSQGSLAGLPAPSDLLRQLRVRFAPGRRAAR